MATSSSRLGYLLLMSTSSGPSVPGYSPPLMTWQVRQLPLPRSKASFWPSAVADWAAAGPAAATIDSASTIAGIRPVFRNEMLVKDVSCNFYFACRFYFACIVSSAPVVRGVRFLPSAVDTILMLAGSAHPLMHGFAIVS